MRQIYVLAIFFSFRNFSLYFVLPWLLFISATVELSEKGIVLVQCLEIQVSTQRSKSRERLRDSNKIDLSFIYAHFAIIEIKSIYFHTDKLRKINIDCIDKDEKFCGSYVANYGNRFCDQDWFISFTGRYGCRLSCNLCDSGPTCEDKDANYCSTYVRVYGQRVCNYQWFISDDGRYGCKKSCDLC